MGFNFLNGVLTVVFTVCSVAQNWGLYVGIFRLFLKIIFLLVYNQIFGVVIVINKHKVIIFQDHLQRFYHFFSTYSF